MRKTIITNVHIFDGEKVTELKKVTIEDEIIIAIEPMNTDAVTEVSEVFDGKGQTLIPGLIDSHIHLTGRKCLEQATDWGITTMLDMASPSKEFVDAHRNQEGLTEIRSCVLPASASGGIQTKVMGFPERSVVTQPEDAKRFVNEQITSGADYSKVIIEDPKIMKSAALTPDIVKALVKVSHQKGMRVFAHASSINALQIGVDAGVDVLCHVPVGQLVSENLIKEIADKKLAVVPTMIMMKGIIQNNEHMPSRRNMDYHYVQENVKLLHFANVPLLAGTDANGSEGSFFTLKHGKSLHEEMQLMVEAGLTPTQALQSATMVPAKLLGLADRGVIKEKMRADLVLVDGDPTKDISITEKIHAVWIAGKQVRN